MSEPVLAPRDPDEAALAPSATHVVLLPIKPPSRGKSRLASVGDDVRRRLAEAFALDTAAACLATPSVAAVLVVTDDAEFSRCMVEIGCAAIPDGASGDLNGSLVHAAEEASRRWPDLIPVALCGDLPALASSDLETALRSAPRGRASFVADAEGVGTTLFTAPLSDFRPSFGTSSRERHTAAGAVALPGDLFTLRRDVDEITDLAEAAALGLGERTAAVVSGASLLPVVCRGAG
jgi:2-phospho-L-lactate guanylyltransferase